MNACPHCGTEIGAIHTTVYSRRYKCPKCGKLSHMAGEQRLFFAVTFVLLFLLIIWLAKYLGWELLLFVALPLAVILNTAVAGYWVRFDPKK